MVNKAFFSWSVLMILALFSAAQIKWKLIKDGNGIKVYLEDTDSSKFKAVKVEAMMPGNIKKFDSIIRDVDNHKRWIYNTKNSSLIRNVNSNEIIYYSETSLPWPLSNRDAVSDMIISMDSVKQTLHVTSRNIDHVVADKNGIVRIPFLKTEWNITAEKPDMLSFVYFFTVDPGGSLSPWMVNSFAAKGPYNTFLNLQKLLKSN